MSSRRPDESLEDLSDRLHASTADGSQLAERIAALLRRIEGALTEARIGTVSKFPGVRKSDNDSAAGGDDPAA